MATETDRRFEGLIRHGMEFVNQSGERYVILNNPEDADVDTVTYENVALETRETKDRETIENWLQWGYWKEAAPLDDETHR